MDFYGESPSSYQNIHPNSLFSFKSQCQDEEFFESPSEYLQPLDESEQETNFRLGLNFVKTCYFIKPFMNDRGFLKEKLSAKCGWLQA